MHKVKKYHNRLETQEIFMINHNPHRNKTEITQFFNKIKIIQRNIIPKINLVIMHKITFHQMMKNTITKIINNFTPTKEFVLTVLSNQIFLNHQHEMNKYDNLETTQQHTEIFNNKIQSTHNQSNQLKCKRQSHCHIIYNNTK